MTMPPGRIIMVRYKSQLSVEDAECAVGRFTSPDQYHVEEVGEGYIITIKNEQAGASMASYLSRINTEFRSLPIVRLMGLDTTGNTELDVAIRNSIIQVFGAPGSF